MINVLTFTILSIFIGLFCIFWIFLHNYWILFTFLSDPFCISIGPSLHFYIAILISNKYIKVVCISVIFNNLCDKSAFTCDRHGYLRYEIKNIVKII